MQRVVQRVQEYHRYCPGEEQIRISDAVCLQRRGCNFPKCKGCPFNDDEKARAERAKSKPATPADATDSEHMTDVFNPYDIRAPYPDLLDREIAWRIGQAVSQFLRSELRGYDRGRKDKATVIVGRDMRKSSPDLASGLIEGLRAGGSPVVDIGMVDAAQLYFATNQLICCGGVMVTGSHHPAKYNGFHICGQKGKAISGETGLSKIFAIASNTKRQSGGKVSELTQRDLSEAYREFIRGFLKPGHKGASVDHPLKGVVDASNGMAGRWVPLLFNALGWLEIIPLNFEHNGEFVHEPDPTKEANLSQLAARVIRSNAHFGICFDGDADRCVLVDEQGKRVRGDHLLALLARLFLKEHPGTTVIHDVRCSRAVTEEIRKAGGVPRRERCGPVYIRKALADAKGAVGGELSGHYYFRDNGYCDSGMIAFAHVLNILTDTTQPLSKLIEPMKRYAVSGERNFKLEDHQNVIDRLTQKYGHGRIDHLDGITVQFADWWFNVRPSHTEPLLRLNMEAKDSSLLESKLEQIVPLLGTPADG